MYPYPELRGIKYYERSSESLDRSLKFLNKFDIINCLITITTIHHKMMHGSPSLRPYSIKEDRSTQSSAYQSKNIAK